MIISPRLKKQLAPYSLLFLLLFTLLTSLTVAAEEILKSPNDNRDYTAITLTNGLRVILVSDPDADKAAASMDVNVGYFQDPNDRPGLAHFLEHMLFLGTKKYPDADSYKDFISNHGGSDNAFTSSEHTNYFFDIDNSNLDEALDRFAQFFVAPLFNEAYVQREMNAVDSEYRLKIKDDGRRIFEVYKSTANPQHPFSKFSVGNLDSLKDRSDSPVRDELIRFYNTYYSANLMTLAIVGKEPLAVLKKMAQRFSDIPNHGAVHPEVTAPIYSQQKTQLDIVPLQDLRSLTLSFTTPWYDRYYQEKPFDLVAHLLGDEGEHSLHALLKDRGWINSLSAGSGFIAINYTSFDIEIDLTEEGLQHVDDITKMVFQAIELVRKQGVKRRIHDEIQKINELAFIFHEKGRPTTDAIALAGNLQNFPTSLAIKGPYVSKPFSTQRIETILSSLTPDNLRRIIVAPNLSTDQIEPYYDTAYKISPISAEKINAWKQAGLNKELAIPPANPFIPEDTSLLTKDSGQAIPKLIIDKTGIQVWYKQNDEFKTPKADISIGLTAPIASDSIEQNLKTSLFTALINDELNAYAYPAQIAGLNYNVTMVDHGLGFTVSGYNDKQDVLITRIIDTLLNYKVKADRLAIIKERMKRNWENADLDRPYHQLGRSLNKLLNPNSWTPDAYLAAIDTITAEDIELHIKALKKSTHIQILIHGNIDKKTAINIANHMTNRLRIQFKAGQELVRHTIKVKPQTQHFKMVIDHNDSAIIDYYQAPNDSTDTQARNLLLLQILENPFFNQLRTIDQLGYVVYITLSRNLRIPGLRFVIQSPVKAPEQLLERINVFIEQQYEQIKAMDEASLEEYKQAILTRLLEKDKRLSERTQRYRNSLALKYLNFNHRQELATAIGALTLEDVSKYYQVLLLDNDKRRIIVSSTGNKHIDAEKPSDITTLDMETIQSFRQAQDDYSL